MRFDWNPGAVWDDYPVIAYEGPAVLRWAANSTIGCDVAALVSATDRGWNVSVVASTGDDQWAVETFPNPWELVFPDGSSFDVEVEADISDGSWTVTEAVRC